MYTASMGKLSQKFRWPSWVIYDQNYRQEAAESGKVDWSRVDASIHALCFNGMAKSTEGWCFNCHSLDHISESCPWRPPSKRPSVSTPTIPPAKWGAPMSNGPIICIKYNKYCGDCKYGPKCRFSHVCSKCRGARSVTACLKPGEHSARPWRVAKTNNWTPLIITHYINHAAEAGNNIIYHLCMGWCVQLSFFKNNVLFRWKYNYWTHARERQG